MAYLIPAGTSSGASPDAISRRRKMAEALLASGMGSEPIASPWQGAAKMAQALVGGLGVRRADRMEREGRASANKALIDALFGGGSTDSEGGVQAFPATEPYRATTGGIGSDKAAAGSGQANQYRDAIASIESAGSGDYSAQGPVTASGDRAYGRYQVMGANVGPWTREVLGRELTPEQFLADPKVQDAVFDAKFGQSVQKYGNPQDAASVWFTGRPQAQGGNSRDMLGTSGNDYVSKFTAALSGRPQIMPAASSGDNRAAMMALLQNEWADPSVKEFVLQRMLPEQDWLSPEAFQQKLDLARAGRSETNVNVGPTGIDYGDPPTDMQWVRNQDGTVQLDERGVPKALPIGGTKLDRETQKAAQAQETVADQEARTGDIVTQDVERALSTIKENPLFTTGIGAQLLAGWGGTKAHDVAGLLDTIKANVGFDRLQQMRNASPTGGALGQVSEFENRLLQSVVGSLEQSQSAPQLMFNLRRVYDIYNKIINEGIQPGDPLASGAEAPTNGLPDGVTEEDVQHTMQIHGLTREQVLERLR